MDHCERTGKKRYASPSEALSALSGLRSTRRKRSNVERKHYRCPYCGGWHVTRMSEPKLRTPVYVPMKRWRFAVNEEE